MLRTALQKIACNNGFAPRASVSSSLLDRGPGEEYTLDVFPVQNTRDLDELLTDSNLA